MRVDSNIQRICRLLCSLGAHLGHLKVEAFQNLSHYVLGGRDLFIIIDLDKTVPMLKAALLFFEHTILHYGHAVFCHSGVARFSTTLLDYLSRVVNSKNQSFSYWRWVPGCITNYRYVFLRLVELLFREVRSKTKDSKLRIIKSYHSSFLSYYNKLWLWFVSECEMKACSFNATEIKNKFNSFFRLHKKVLLNKYLTNVFKRNIVEYSVVRKGLYNYSNRRARLSSDLINALGVSSNRRTRGRIRASGTKASTLRTLPSFVSFLFRICYVMKQKSDEIMSEYKNKHLNDEALFSFIFRRLHVFWRAMIFFKCFKKTAHIPDCMVLLNPDNSNSEFRDFIGVRLPIICVADTTTDLSSISYPIPSNDDSIVLFLFYLHVFLESVTVACSMRFLL